MRRSRIAVADGSGAVDGEACAGVRVPPAAARPSRLRVRVPEPAPLVEQHDVDVDGVQLGGDQLAEPGADVVDGAGVDEGLGGDVPAEQVAERQGALGRPGLLQARHPREDLLVGPDQRHPSTTAWLIPLLHGPSAPRCDMLPDARRR